MPSQAGSQADSAPGVTAAAPWRLSELSVLPGYRLAVRFLDGTRGVVDLSALVTRADAGVFAALRAPELFAQARLELGAPTWPNGADLDPDWLHEEISKAVEFRLG